MSYEKVQQASKIIVGMKQTVKALKSGKADELIVADDADPFITKKVVEIAFDQNISVTRVDSMKMLGKACKIHVGASAVAVIY